MTAKDTTPAATASVAAPGKPQTQLTVATSTLSAPAHPASTAQAVVLQAPKTPLLVDVKDHGIDWANVMVSGIVSLAVAGGAALIGYFVTRWQVIKQQGITKWQIGEQHKEAIAQHKQTVKADLKLGAYRDFQDALTKYYACEHPDVRIALIRIELQTALNRSELGQGQAPVSARAWDFIQRIGAFLQAVNALIFLIERYESLLPGFDIFRTAFASASHDIVRRKAKFEQVLTFWLPMDSNGNTGAILNHRQILPQTLVDFDNAAAGLDEPINLLKCWVADLAVDMQNFLLGEYADQRVKRREPIDPTFFVVTNDTADRADLDRRFNKTEYKRSGDTAVALARAVQAQRQAEGGAGHAG